MKVLPSYNQTQFLGFVPKIKKSVREWWIVEIMMTGDTHHNSSYIALKMQEYFDGQEGIIFICNSKNILVLVHMGKDVNADAIVYDICSKMPSHSCTARATDITPDGLMKLQVRLEALEQDNKLQPQSAAFAAIRNSRPERTVMVVDDDMLMRTLVNNTFRTQSRVIEFNDTQKVLEAYLENLPDVVFLDIHLPGGSGIDLLKQLVSFDEHAYVIILSGDSAKDNIISIKDNGAKGFIAKPFTLEKLRSVYDRCPTVVAHRHY